MKLRVEMDDGTVEEVDVSPHLTTLRQEEHLHRLVGDEGYDAYVQGKRYPPIVRALIVVHLADRYPDIDPDTFDATVAGLGDSGKAVGTS